MEQGRELFDLGRVPCVSRHCGPLLHGDARAQYAPRLQRFDDVAVIGGAQVAVAGRNQARGNEALIRREPSAALGLQFDPADAAIRPDEHQIGKAWHDAHALQAACGDDVAALAGSNVGKEPVRIDPAPYGIDHRALQLELAGGRRGHTALTFAAKQGELARHFPSPYRHASMRGGNSPFWIRHSQDFGSQNRRQMTMERH
jgi:hypothetical protein